MTVTATPLFRGDFEAHLTVRADGTEQLDALERYAAAHGLKFAHIVLARGRMVSQPMLTVRASGTLAAVRDSIAELHDRLEAAGFPVVRAKIEATPWSAGVPSTDADALALGPRYYFEHHVKLLLDPDFPAADLAALAQAHSAHLSANARRTRPDGRTERFVTQRCRLVGDATATARYDELLASLRAQHHEILSAEREFVVHDTDESIDDGWITESGKQQ